MLCVGVISGGMCADVFAVVRVASQFVSELLTCVKIRDQIIKERRAQHAIQQILLVDNQINETLATYIYIS